LWDLELLCFRGKPRTALVIKFIHIDYQLVKYNYNTLDSYVSTSYVSLFQHQHYLIMYSSELIKGTLKTIVLKLLAENKRMYGYEITQKVKDLTGNKIQITEGALYPTLHALEADGILITETEYIGKRVRKYYSLSKEGHNKSKEKVNEFADFMNTMKFLLEIKTA
jgi:DNA-binding PadR family transcriptional regulator